LRRSSLVEFDGVCSGDAFVLRENHAKIVPGFLAFVVNSEKLWDFANANAAGTMSKRVKWRDLANFEFLLPPINQQEKLAELLWSGIELVEKNVEIQKRLSELKKCILENEIDINSRLEKVTIKKLKSEGAIVAIQDGNHGDIHPKASDYVSEGIPFIMANSFIDEKLNIEDCKRLPKEICDKLRIGFSIQGDVLLTHKATIGNTAIVPELSGVPYLMLTPQVTYYRVNPKKLSNVFLFNNFKTPRFKKQIVKYSAQSTRSYIGITAQEDLTIQYTPDLSIQSKINEKINKIELEILNFNNSIKVVSQINNIIINRIFQ
jgi:type I restriction enzyme S subunit